MEARQGLGHKKPDDLQKLHPVHEFFGSASGRVSDGQGIPLNRD